MYLKSIEIQGFKSFANKIRFEFHDGITAIVGPNGSGKSNVADAVRWVLGEQSAKQLRGAKMEDVIFSGTQTRKPLGYAYVAITLDNSDHKIPTSYEELTVARRVYRSGESEYLINGSSCRLRDVQELFLDTGIGKEGYSIIGQGQIDKILNGKPEDRRELFDEAAGIVKFKKRKAAAEKNLEAEKQNLLRIKDILSEIEHQVIPLEEQAETAKEYLRLRDDLKNLEISQFLAEQDRIKTERTQTEEKYGIVENDLVQLRAAYDSTKEEYEKLEQKLEEIGQTLENDRNFLNEGKVKKEQLEGEINVLNEQIIAARQNDSHYKERTLAVEGDMKAREGELEQYQLEKLELNEKLDSMEDARASGEKKLNEIQSEMDRINMEIDRCNGEIFNILNENTAIKTKKQRYETMLEQNVLKKTGLRQKTVKLKTDETTFSEVMDKDKEALEQITAKITALLEKKEQEEMEIQALEKKSSLLKEDYAGKHQENLIEKSRLESLKNITERYEGYGQSIRRVMEHKASEGIIGVVADIIKVEKKFEIALETALGGNIQNIVTDNEATAKQMIDYLKKNKFGRATFLPLTTVKGTEKLKNELLLKEEGILGRACSLVKTQSRFGGIMEYLLGRVYVAENIDRAIAIHKKYNHSIRLVTLEGELLNPGGSMSGGAYKNSGNLLSRRREIEDLTVRIQEKEAVLSKLSLQLDANRSLRANKKLTLQNINNLLQELYLEQNTAGIKCNQTKSDMQNILEGYAEVHKKLVENESQIRELQGYLVEVEQQLLENERRSKENDEAIAAFQKELEEIRLKRTGIREQNAALQLDFSALEQNDRFILENIKRIKGELEKLREEQDHLLLSRNDSIFLVKQREENIIGIKNSIQEFELKNETVKSDIIKWESEKDKIAGRHKNFFSEREKLSEQMIHLEREKSRLWAQLEKMEDQLDQQMNYMWEEYELTPQRALELVIKTELSSALMKKSIGDYKLKIKGLGEVNVNAIEDYKNLSERYQLLNTQHNDLIEAEEVLRGIILELDQEMRRQFEEKFLEIKEQFDLVFRELFGGGKGTLLLMEDEDILDAGIRIIAQPPGKKLQNMMQLSGGEKALTAISLLFAIQNLKPSPFCLLDEIEAALDDSNVERFAKYLHKLTSDTQFIVITHRRGTMGAADILYGITMQEKGVSTLVSVSLIENELDKEPSADRLAE